MQQQVGARERLAAARLCRALQHYQPAVARMDDRRDQELRLQLQRARKRHLHVTRHARVDSDIHSLRHLADHGQLDTTRGRRGGRLRSFFLHAYERVGLEA